MSTKKKDKNQPICVNLMSSSVQAGFPSPVSDMIEKELSLDDYLIEHPQQSFFVRAQGDSMIEAGIFSGDILVIDRLKKPNSGKIIIAIINGEMTVKELYLPSNNDGKNKYQNLELRPANKNFPVLKFTNEDEFEIWGVVVGVVRKM